MKKTLLASTSTLVVGLVLANPASADTFVTNHTADADTGGSSSVQTDVVNLNTVGANTFQNLKGIASVLQNSGANDAVNNGNTVDAIIANGGSEGDLDFTVTSNQDAQQGERNIDPRYR